jgi:hypothetical protein
MGAIQKINEIRNYLDEIVSLLGSGQANKTDLTIINKIYDLIK